MTATVNTGASQSGAIAVDGLIQFQRSLKLADAALPRELRVALNEIASDIIVPEANKLVAFYLSRKPANARRRKGTLENSVRARSQQREGRVLLGIGGSNEYAAWWEFGGSTKAPRGGQRLIYKSGRSLYPALHVKRAEVQAALEKHLTRLAAIANG